MDHYELRMKNFVIGFLVLAILGIGVAVGLLLVNQQQIFKQKAATPTGQATVSIQPAVATFQRNNPYPVSVYFNTSGLLISDVKIRLTFSNLGVAASGVQINQTLLSSGDWTCPVKSISSNGSTGIVDIDCTNSSPAGFSTQADTLLATFNLTASEVPVVNPLIVNFDPQSSTITQKSGQDILLTPASTGSYTITDTIAQSPTATPLLVIASSSPTPLGTLPPVSPTPTASGSSIFGISSPTPTASSSATLPPIPVTGFDTPTIIGAGAGGILLLIGATALIF